MTVDMVKKFVVAVIGAASMAVTQGLISGTAARWVAIGIAVATAAGVYIVPNTAPTAAARGPQPQEDRP